MAPVEFEKELQKRMRSREIEPRTDSWDRIEARLEAEVPTRKRSPLKWKILAAASVVFLLGYFLLPESSMEIPEGNGVVESPEADLPETPESYEKATDFIIKSSDTQLGVTSTEKEDKKSVSSKSPVVQLNLRDKDESLSRADLTNQSHDVVSPDIQKEFRISDPGVIAAVAAENEVEGTDDSEVDALLSEALLAVEGHSAAQDTITLNPSMLLGEVESELDLTFREQILKKLKTGYNKVRTAVADRQQ